MSEERVTIYTDGGCAPNPGPGGWAALYLFRGAARFIAGYSEHSTNNRMELTAAIEALKNLKWPAEVEIRTDSRYLKDGIQIWLKNWREKNWRTSSNKPVLNQDLWIELSHQMKDHRTRWAWVRGHSTDKYNNFVDGLVRGAIEARASTDMRMTMGDLERMIISTRHR
jgi:ribonuclease HI